MEYISAIEREYGATTQEPYALVSNELLQAEETGHDVTAFRARLERLGFSGSDDEELRSIYAEIPQRPVDGWSHFESSDLAEIESTLPPVQDQPLEDGPDLENRMRGAWHGRVAGNMAGKPIEFPWPRAQVREYLQRYDAYPLRDYVPIPPAVMADLVGNGFLAALVGFDFTTTAKGSIDGGERDDDIDYTVLGLHLLETYGTALTPEDVGREWLTRLPVNQVCTAERATYQNLVREVPLAEVGSFHNPYREWIGALIRADIFGYAHPGCPRRAALLAHRDAVLSHRANGVYGEMWAAALISSAFTATSPRASIDESLRHVPPTSRLAEEIRTILADHDADRTWEQAIEALEQRHPTMSGVHTINNAGALTAALLYGNGDFTNTVGYAAQAGLDADSIGATAGSWAGAFVGYTGIATHWLEPLHGRYRSAVFGFSSVDLNVAADRTLKLVGKLRQDTRPEAANSRVALTRHLDGAFKG